jgi:hypothetical protein
MKSPACLRLLWTLNGASHGLSSNSRCDADFPSWNFSGLILVENGRGNRAIEKLGAVYTGTALQVPDPDGNIGDVKKWEFLR